MADTVNPVRTRWRSSAQPTYLGCRRFAAIQPVGSGSGAALAVVVVDGTGGSAMLAVSDDA
jgi:hypothetical protein